MRLKLTIEYDGGPYFGWQKHADFPSVQAALEDAVFKLTGARSEILGAGRTDAGVHACGQVAHVDIDKDLAPGRIRDGLNAHLRPNPIVILDAEEAAPDFHARFSAKKRRYRYRILARKAPPAIEKGRVWWIPRALDADAMAQAAPLLIGHHDFTTFRDTNCQAKSPIKSLDSLDVRRDGEIIEIWCEAQSFLHRQVRSMVGSLVEIGVGKWSADDLRAALEAKDRTRCGPVAAAEGLYLMRVTY